MPPLLRIAGVSKTYQVGLPWRARPVSVLQGVDVELGGGEILCVTGSNGSGKTTLLKIAASLTLPDRGDVEVDGCSVHAGAHARRLIGFASGDDRMLFPRLTGAQNLRFFARLHDLGQRAAASEIEKLVQCLDLSAELDRAVDRCSSGARVRFGLARALLHGPRVLLLDEPTRSLDAAHTSAVHDLVRRFSDAGAVIVMATHDVDEVDRLATHVGELRDGRLSISTRSARTERVVRGEAGRA